MGDIAPVARYLLEMKVIKVVYEAIYERADRESLMDMPLRDVDLETMAEEVAAQVMTLIDGGVSG